MSAWTLLDYVESDRNRVREWLDGLSPADQARIDVRLLKMQAMERWPEKWVSTYTAPEKLYEFRIKGSVQFRPLGTYFGSRRYVILIGAVEKGGKLPRSDVQTACERCKTVGRDPAHAIPHQFDSDEALEKDAE